MLEGDYSAGTANLTSTDVAVDCGGDRQQRLALQLERVKLGKHLLGFAEARERHIVEPEGASSPRNAGSRPSQASACKRRSPFVPWYDLLAVVRQTAPSHATPLQLADG